MMMFMRNPKFLPSLLFSLLFAGVAYGQIGSVQISGSTAVSEGQQSNYTAVAKNNFGHTISFPTYLGYSWYVPDNTVTTSTVSSATIQWTRVGTFEIFYEFETYNNIYTDDLEVTVSPVPPSAPSAKTAVDITTGSFTALWDPVGNADTYRLDVSTSSTFSSFVSGYQDLSVDGTSMAVTGLQYNTTYRYRVRAVNAAGTSSSSTTITTTTMLAYPPVATPASHVTNNSFTAHWQAVDGITSYKLDVSENPEFSSFVSGYDGLTVNGTSRALSGLTSNKDHYYRVRSIRDGGTSAVSNTTMVMMDYSYVKSVDVTAPGVTDVSDVAEASGETDEQIAAFNYVDGLGRPMQTVQVKASPTEHDVVAPIVYDEFGREPVKYLPYATDEVNGYYKVSPVTGTSSYTGSPHQLFYSNGAGDQVADDTKPYAKTEFEPSPLNRLAKQGAPGDAWQPNSNASLDHSIKKAYELNKANEVRWFTYNAQTEKANLDQQVYYAANELYANRTIDEHNNEVIEYVDKEGRTLLKKVQYKEESGVKLYAETYYIYDDFGNLVIVLPPEAVKKLTPAP